MTDRLLGVETEYALGAGASRATGLRPGQVLEAILCRARTRLLHLPDEFGHGIFLSNGARFYVDCGGHPEFATPECTTPGEVVRYVRAGETILLDLAREHGALVFRCNVDYSGARTSWGMHESFLHRVDPRTLPRQLIPHLVSRLVYAGAGGFNNRSPGLEFTLSPRTIHLSQETSSDSTLHRGIFHTKNETLSGSGSHRLHVLCGETLCSDLALWLKVGTTALVVAMSEAGIGPGEAVQLRNPLAAMRAFAGDPTCTTTAETQGGARLSAVAIQRHYLTQAEAHATDPFMPPWAGEVCRRWRAVLDQLTGGAGAVATQLDWAIKHALYGDQLRRRGFPREAVSLWTTVATRLTAALSNVPNGDRPLTADVVLGRDSPIAAQVAELTTAFMRPNGLCWDDLAAFLRARSELFEIDMRFGQLGAGGIFTALHAAGLLAQHVDGVDDIAGAVDSPPAGSRARLRGQLVRDLAGNGGRYGCDWQGVWDRQERRRVDLSDPFATTWEWKEWQRDDGASPDGMLARMQAELRMLRSGQRAAGRRARPGSGGEMV